MKVASILFLVLMTVTTSAYAQNSTPVARKFDEFTEGIGNRDYRYGYFEQQSQIVKARLALYERELLRVGARPYAITYSPRIVPWQIYDRSIAEMRGSTLWNIAADWRDINLVNGGYREVAATELWIVPPGAQPPCPTPTVKHEDVAYCPFLRIEGVPYIPNPEKPIVLRGQVEVNSDKVKPGFSWEVSEGEIVSGQGTDSISVKVPAGSEGILVARVRLHGFSLECPVQSTTTIARAAYGLRHFLFDEFGDIHVEDEKARLDNLATNLQHDPTLQVHIVFYGGRSSPPGLALARAARAKDYLVNTRAMEASRILTVDGGYRDGVSGEYWLSVIGSEAPPLHPTLDRSYVKPKARIRRN